MDTAIDILRNGLCKLTTLFVLLMSSSIILIILGIIGLTIEDFMSRQNSTGLIVIGSFLFLIFTIAGISISYFCVRQVERILP